jgi:chromosome segregation ATPase
MSLSVDSGACAAQLESIRSDVEANSDKLQQTELRLLELGNTVRAEFSKLREQLEQEVTAISVRSAVAYRLSGVYERLGALENPPSGDCANLAELKGDIQALERGIEEQSLMIDQVQEDAKACAARLGQARQALARGVESSLRADAEFNDLRARISTLKESVDWTCPAPRRRPLRLSRPLRRRARGRGPEGRAGQKRAADRA